MSISVERLFLAPTLMAGALALGGCGVQLEAALKTAPPDSAFEAGLHGGYIGLAQAEYDEADYRDSDNFARRATATAGGAAPGPEALASRRLPEDAAAGLNEARGRLVDALGAGAIDKVPDTAARAQIMFDCWMQEQEENFQPGDIEACRAGFMAAMEEIDLALAPPPPPPPPPPEPVAEPDRAYTVFFAFDSDALGAEARAVVAGIVGDWGAREGAIFAIGHADTSGPAIYNQGLSMRRAAAVGQALRDGGIDPARVTETGVGETELAIETGDGVYEPGNRRVVVRVE